MTIKLIDKQHLVPLLTVLNVKYDCSTGNPSFDDEFTFRIPIEDYLLQLDYRIKAAFGLIDPSNGFLLCRQDMHWSVAEAESNPFHALLGQLSVGGAHAIHLDAKERSLAFAFGYLTNRWGVAGESLYIVPDTRTDVMLYFSASQESVFVICKSRDIHDAAVAQLRKANVPAFGPEIKKPLLRASYSDFDVGGVLCKVDPKTGKPIGAGSLESALLPQFVPPPK